MQSGDGFIKEPATDLPLLIRQFGYQGAAAYPFTAQYFDQFNYLYEFYLRP